MHFDWEYIIHGTIYLVRNSFLNAEATRYFQLRQESEKRESTGESQYLPSVASASYLRYTFYALIL